MILAAVVYPPNAAAGRAVIMAVVVGVYAAKVAETRVVLGVVGVSMPLFAWLLVNGFGGFTGSGLNALGYLFLIAFAAVLGRGHRWMRAPVETGRSPALPATDGG
jgi:predicted membrane-bound mannosyltransferase